MTLEKSVENVTEPEAKVTRQGDILRYTVALENTGAADGAGARGRGDVLEVDDIGICEVEGVADNRLEGDRGRAVARYVKQEPNGAFTGSTFVIDVTVKPEPKIAR